MGYTMVVRVVDVANHHDEYGFLTFKMNKLGDSEPEAAEVQAKINEIKEEFEKEGIDDWCVTDIFERFPENWNWEFNDDEYAVVTV
jgi:hypothetical protein